MTSSAYENCTLSTLDRTQIIKRVGEREKQESVSQSDDRLAVGRVRLSASRGGIGTMRAALAPFFRHSATATATAIGAVAVFPCVT